MKTELIALLKKKWVTPLMALQQLQCMSLSQRVGELRRSGEFAIADKWVCTDTKRYKAYRIVASKKA